MCLLPFFLETFAQFASDLPSVTRLPDSYNSQLSKCRQHNLSGTFYFVDMAGYLFATVFIGAFSQFASKLPSVCFINAT